MLCTPDPTSTPPVHTACTRYAHMLYHHYPVLPSTVPTWATTMGLVCALNPSLSHHGTLSQRHATKYSMHSGSPYVLYPRIIAHSTSHYQPSTSPYGYIPCIPWAVPVCTPYHPSNPVVCTTVLYYRIYALYTALYLPVLTHPIPLVASGCYTVLHATPDTALCPVLHCTCS